MIKFKMPRIFKEISLVILQFLIIILHFIKLEFFPKIVIIPLNSIFTLVGFLIIIMASFMMLISIKDLGSNLSPFPRPVANGSLITFGIYRYLRHPMYYSLMLISLGVFVINLTLYYLCLTIILSLIVKFKIVLEDQYLNNKFNKYFLYKNKVKF